VLDLVLRLIKLVKRLEGNPSCLDGVRWERHLKDTIHP